MAMSALVLQKASRAGIVGLRSTQALEIAGQRIVCAPVLSRVQSAVLPPAACRCNVSATAASAFSSTKILGPMHTTVCRDKQQKVIRNAMKEGNIRPDNSSGSVPEGLARPSDTRAPNSASAMPHDIEHDAATVRCEWLKSRLKDVKVLDASWYMPAEKRKPEEEYLKCHIPGALFFDIDKVSRDDTDLPHMLPSGSVFGRKLAELGISPEDRVVVYDGKGIFSAPRAWWIFRAFGHERVHVLEGGLPRWKALGYETESERPESSGRGALEQNDAPALKASLLREAEDVQRNLETKDADVIDARGAGRFHGTEPEPRKGVRGGHIPGSINVPFPQVLTPEGLLKSEEELRTVFASAGVSLDRPIITSCGTGVTACVLALALHKLGKKDAAVYDGSWTEWGGREDLPIVTN